MDASGWDLRYAAPESPWPADPNRWVQELTSDLPVGTALDLAAGDGRNARWLASRGWAVEAVDFSAVALQNGKKMPHGDLVRWTHRDVLDFWPSHPVSLVVICYLHLPRRQFIALLQRAGTWVQPGGALVVVGHAVRNLTDGTGGPQQAAVLHDRDLYAEGTVGLSIRRLDEVLRSVPSAGDSDKQAVDIIMRADRPSIPGGTAEEEVRR